MEERLSQAKLAEKLNKSKAYISQLKKDKKLVFDSDNKITYENAVKQLSKHAERVNNSVNGRVSTDNDDDSLTFWKKENEKISNKIKQIELDKALKTVVDIEEVKKDAYLISAKLKDKLLAMPDRIATILAAEPDPLKIRETLNKEIKQVLNEIANELEK